MLAHEAASQLDLDEVLLVPVGESGYKRIDPDPGREARLEMTKLASDGDPLLEASDVETGREGPSYTFETLGLLHERRPDDEFVFLMGADVAAGLEDWREPRRVIQLARVGIAARPGSALEEARATLEQLGAGERATFIEMPAIGISSTAIRRRVAQGRAVRYLVPEAVERFIREHGLYGE